MYIDAYDVFMIPNVHGMLLYGNINNKKEKENHMMKRPYFCSSNYILKMSNYKTSKIVINNVEYQWTEIMDSLYYNNINNYSDKLIKIYSCASSVYVWNKFDKNKKQHLLKTSDIYLKYLFS